MDMLYTIGITLATLAILVAVHEFGHFWVARRCGVKVLRFSIGFGPSLMRWRDKLDTEYSIAAIPLGGYVKMLDEREGEVPAAELEQAFNRKSVGQRIAVVSAGPLANFILAIAVYWGLFLAGESGYAPVIGEVESGSVADVAGLEVGQEIIAVDGEKTPTWQALSFRLLDRIGDTGAITFAVKYPDSDVVYESHANIDRWLAGQEQPDLFGGLGLTMFAPPVPPIVSDVVPGGAADKAGIHPGDEVVAADGVPMPLWIDWVEYVRARPGTAIELEYRRDGELMQVSLVPERIVEDGGEAFGRVGMDRCIRRTGCRRSRQTFHSEAITGSHRCCQRKPSEEFDPGSD